MYELGIDISHWQGNMDFDKAVNAGVKFVIAKMTEGNSFYDKMFSYNYDACLARGLRTGIYHFVRTNVSAASQFSWIKSKLPTVAGPMLCLDCERHDNQKDANTTTSIIANISNMIADYLGERPIIYTNQGYADAYLLPWSGWKQHRLWVANWTDADQPAMPKHWTDWYIWQYKVHVPGSDYGSDSGPNGGIDLNRMHIEQEPGVYTANISVNIDGVKYAGNAVLNKV